MRIGVAGVGYWGPRLVRVLVELGHEVPVYDPDVERKREIARRYACAEADSYEHLLESVEAVCLATPIQTHFALALEALTAGKHVFVEKPLTTGHVTAQYLAQVARKANLCLFPGHTFLWSTPVNYIKSILDQGRIGDACSISMQRRNVNTWRSDASVLQDLAPHDFSILRYWLDELPSRIDTIQRMTSKQPDTAFCNLVFPQGVIASVELGWLSPVKLRATTIIGTQGMITYDDLAIDQVRVYAPDGTVLASPLGVQEEPIRRMLVAFEAGCADPTLSDVQIGIDVVKMIAQAEAGATTICSIPTLT